MGTVTKSIGTATRDYSTLQAWEDALPANLVTDGNAQVGECYNDTEFSASVVFSGSTTDATNYIELTAAAGESFQDHADVQTNALRYNQSNGVGLTETGNTTCFSVQEANVTIKRLQSKNTNSYASGSPWHTTTTSLGVSGMEDMICETANSTQILFAKEGTFRNCLFLINRSTTGKGHFNSYAGSSVYENCTFARPSNFTAGDTAWQIGNTGTTTFKNCASFGWTTLTAGTGTFAGNNNCSDLAIGFGSSNQASKTYANQFEEEDQSVGSDFRLKAGSDMIDTGATLTLATDIAGTSRPQGSAWDIGAWELVAAAADTLWAQSAL